VQCPSQPATASRMGSETVWAQWKASCAYHLFTRTPSCAPVLSRCYICIPSPYLLLCVQTEREGLKQSFINKKKACRANIVLLPENLSALKDRELKELQEQYRDVDADFKALGVMVERNTLLEGGSSSARRTPDGGALPAPAPWLPSARHCHHRRHPTGPGIPIRRSPRSLPTGAASASMTAPPLLPTPSRSFSRGLRACSACGRPLRRSPAAAGGCSARRERCRCTCACSRRSAGRPGPPVRACPRSRRRLR
jgi:hypothetical protein